MFVTRWCKVIATYDGINKRWLSSSWSTEDDDEREVALKFALLVGEDEDGDDEEEQHGDVCLVLQEEEENDDSSPLETWCSNGRLAIVLLNLMNLVRGLLILTFVFLEDSAAVINQQADNNRDNTTMTTTTSTTISPIWNVLLLMMDLLLVLIVFVIPFVLGLLGAFFYQKHMVLFALVGFLVYVVFDFVFDTTEVWAFFAVVRLVCYSCVASIFINQLHRNKNRRRRRNFLLLHVTKENDCTNDDNNKSDPDGKQDIVDNA